MPATEYTISISTIFKVVLTVIVLTVLYRVIDILAILFLAIVIASGIDPLIEFLKEYRFSRVGAAILIYIFGFIVMALIFYAALPPLIDEFSSFLRDFPKIEHSFISSDFFESLPFYSTFRENIQAVSATGLDILQGASGNFIEFFVKIFGGVVSFILLIVVSFYLSVQERGIQRFLQSVLPLRYETYAMDLWDRSRKKLGIWLRTMFILMAIVGTLVYISTTLLGIKYSFLLGMLSAGFELVPIVGPVLAATPGVILGLIQSPTTGLLALLSYVIIQQLEGHVMVPLLMQRAIGLNPILIILGLLVGGRLGGVLGLLIAVPFTVIIVEIVSDFDTRRRTAA